MDKVLHYSPYILLILLFLWQNRVFVTPEQMEKRFTDFALTLESKFVLQQTHNIAIAELKSDVTEIKEKIDKIYDFLIVKG